MINQSLVDDPTALPLGFNLPRHLWANLNHFRTGQGQCAANLARWHKIPHPSYSCGAAKQTMSRIVNDCPLSRFPGGLTTSRWWWGNQVAGHAVQTIRSSLRYPSTRRPEPFLHFLGPMGQPHWWGPSRDAKGVRWGHCVARISCYRPVYSFLGRQRYTCRVQCQSLCGSEVKWPEKLNSCTSSGARAPVPHSWRR